MAVRAPTLEEVLQAIDTLYHQSANNKDDKRKASLWLTELANSVCVWEIADQLLLLKRDMETSFFAAQTMQRKIRHSFYELPQENHEDLKASLMNHLEQFCDSPAPVLRQLAMALVDLVIQLTNSSVIVRELITRYGGNEKTVCAMLEVLTLLPEEIHNRVLRLGQNRRKELKQQFGQEWTLFLELIISYMTSLSHVDEVSYRVFFCVGSWLKMGNFPAEQLVQTGIILRVFQVLEHGSAVSEKVFEAAADCICSALYVCDTDGYSDFGLYLKAMVRNLQPVFVSATQQEDYARAHNLSCIFIEMADTFLYHMVHQTTQDLGDLVSLELLLCCASHYDYEVVGSTFNVWYRLAEELSKVNDTSLNTEFMPYVEKLFLELAKHCQIDEDTSPMSVMTDDSDDFTNFRANVVEVIKDVNFILGARNVFELLYVKSCEPGVAWNVKESCLFIMYSVSSSLSVTESEVLPIALPVLLSIPPDTHYAIRATTLRLVGELASWIDQHPDVLDTVFNFLETGLRTPALANAAAAAVQNVCVKCKDRLGQRMKGLLDVTEVAYQVGISNDTMLGLLKGIVEVITRQPHEQMNKYLEFLCQLPFQYLSTMVNQSSHLSVAPTSSGNPCVWLDRLSTIFRSCYLDLKDEEVHPCIEALSSCLPLVVKVCYTFKTEIRVVERSCRCLRFMLRTFRVATSPLIGMLLDMCMDIYLEHKHSCFLYLGSIVVDEFGSNVSFHPALVQFLERMSAIAFPLLAGDTGLLHHPDTVDDMFRMCARYLQRCPQVFFQNEVYPVATQCALAALTFNHRDAYASVMKYLRDLISSGSVQTKVEEMAMVKVKIDTFIESYGLQLMEGIVHGFVYLPSVMISDSAEVLWAMLVYAREPMVQALANSISRIAEVKADVTMKQKEKFVTSVSTCQSLDDLHGHIRQYSRLYR